MKKFIGLMELIFDWSSGEYHKEHVEDVYVGIFEANTPTDAVKLIKNNSEKILFDHGAYDYYSVRVIPCEC
jgi:hypothetical protein